MYTDFERAAAIFYVYAGCTDRKTLFTIAEGTERINGLKETSLKVMAANWFNSHRFQELVRQYKVIKEDEERKIIEKYLSENETETTQGQKAKTAKNGVNFLNPDEFLQFANLQANEITDEKERREYLKMIASLMNYKDSDDGEQEQIKAYLPVNCQVCDLYKRCSRCKFDVCPVEML